MSEEGEVSLSSRSFFCAVKWWEKKTTLSYSLLLQIRQGGGEIIQKKKVVEYLEALFTTFTDTTGCQVGVILILHSRALPHKFWKVSVLAHWLFRLYSITTGSTFQMFILRHRWAKKTIIRQILKSQCPGTFVIQYHYREHFSESVPAWLIIISNFICVCISIRVVVLHVLRLLRCFLGTH